MHALLYPLAFIGATSILLPALWLAMAKPRDPALLDECSPACCGGPSPRDPARRHAYGCPMQQAA